MLSRAKWLIAATAVFIALYNPSACPTSPSTPSKNMKMEISFSRIPELGATVEVEFRFTLRDSIKHHGNAKDSAWIQFPPDARFVSGQTSWSGMLVNGVTERIRATLSLDSNMLFSVAGFVQSERIDLTLLPAEVALRYESTPYGYLNKTLSDTFVVGEIGPQRNSVPAAVFFGDRDSSWIGRLPFDSVPGHLAIAPDGKKVLLDNQGAPLTIDDTLRLYISSDELAQSSKESAPIERILSGSKRLIKLCLPPETEKNGVSVNTSSKEVPKVPYQIHRDGILFDRSRLNIADTINIIAPGFKVRLIAVWQSPYQISGNFTYLDNWGIEQPARYCAVRLYVLENGFYYLDATTQTLGSGYFQVECDHPDWQIVVYSSNDRATTLYAEDHAPTVGDLLYAYAWAVIGSNHFEDVQIPSQYTTITDVAGTGSWNICNIGLHGADYVVFVANTEVEAFYCWDPSDLQTTTSYLSGSIIVGDTRLIFIDAFTAQPGDNGRDEWDSIIVLHEYSHLLMDKLASMSGPNYAPHYFDRPDLSQTSEVLKVGAYKEGWATFLASAMIYDGSHQYPRYFSRDKNNNFTNQYWFEFPDPDIPYSVYPQSGPTISPPLFEGANVEGAIMIALRDVFDSRDDGNYFLGSQLWGHNNDYNSADYWQGIDYIWDVFWEFDPRPNDPSINYCRTIYDFIHGWRVRGYPVAGHFIDIFEAHNVAVFVPGDADGNGLVTISDPVYVITWVFGGGPAPVEVLAAADADGSCVTDVSDAVYLITFIFGGGRAPVPGCS